MSSPELYHALLRPPVIQILRAAGFHAAPPSVVDILTDLGARYLLLLAESLAAHAHNSHEDVATPNLDDAILAMHDAGALRPQMTPSEEAAAGKEDLRGVALFVAWFSSPAFQEIRRVAGFVPSEGDVVDADKLEKEDYLTALKKKHSKTGEESRYQGTVLGKSNEPHPIVIEGGAGSIRDWKAQIAGRASTPKLSLDGSPPFSSNEDTTMT